MFESFAPVERSLSLAFRLLLRSKGARLRGEAVPDSQAAYKLALDTVSQTIDLGASPAELGRVLHAYVEDIPTHVVETITSRKELVGEDGQVHPYDVIAGRVFPMVTRASYGSRLEWFQSSDWSKVSCILRGFLPSVREDKEGPMDTRRGFEEIAQREAFEVRFAHLPVQPDDKFRVWGGDSFALLLTFGSVFREDVAQQCGFGTPVSSGREKRTRPGLWLTVVDPDATATASGFASHVEGGAAGVEASTAHSNAAVLGKSFAKWLGNCTRAGRETTRWGTPKGTRLKLVFVVAPPDWAFPTRAPVGSRVMPRSVLEMLNGTSTGPSGLRTCWPSSASPRTVWPKVCPCRMLSADPFRAKVTCTSMCSVPRRLCCC